MDVLTHYLGYPYGIAQGVQVHGQPLVLREADGCDRAEGAGYGI